MSPGLGLGTTVSNIQHLPWHNKYSLSFNGSTESMTAHRVVGDIDTDTGTFSVWVKLDTSSNNMQIIKTSVDSNNNIQIYHRLHSFLSLYNYTNTSNCNIEYNAS